MDRPIIINYSKSCPKFERVDLRRYPSICICLDLVFSLQFWLYNILCVVHIIPQQIWNVHLLFSSMIKGNICCSAKLKVTQQITIVMLWKGSNPANICKSKRYPYLHSVYQQKNKYQEYEYTSSFGSPCIQSGILIIILLEIKWCYLFPQDTCNVFILQQLMFRLPKHVFF